MNNRMNKEELIGLIETLKINRNSFWVLSSGALVLRGIFPDAGDLDIAVTKEGFEELKNNYNLVSKGNGFYIINDKVECICDGKIEDLKFKPEKIGDYFVQNIEEYLKYLKTSTREKDKLRISIVEKYISDRKDKLNKVIQENL